MPFPKLNTSFYLRDVLQVASGLLGKTIVRRFNDGSERRFKITEVEAYRGTEDLACHASKGKTARTEVMFRDGGVVYVYLIYGMYWMLNIVTGLENDASAVLIRGLDDISGPGKVGKILQLDKSFYGEDLLQSNRIWIEDSNKETDFTTSPRIGINYAGEPWVSKSWRFTLKT
jgi:DNA-3-methyladenine glycosylase